MEGKRHPCSGRCDKQLQDYIDKFGLHVQLRPLTGTATVTAGMTIIQCPAHGRAWQLSPLRK